MMACKEKIDYLLLDVQELEKTIAGMRDAEMYPVSFFSRSFELTRKIWDALHTLESVQVDLLRKQMEEHAAMLSELPYAAGVRRSESAVPADALSAETSSGETAGRNAACVSGVITEENTYWHETSLSESEDPVSGMKGETISPVSSAPAFSPVTGTGASGSGIPQPDAAHPFSGASASFSDSRPDRTEPVVPPPALSGNDAEETAPAVIPENPASPAAPEADEIRTDSGEIAGGTAVPEEKPAIETEENPEKAAGPVEPRPVVPAPELRGERAGNGGLSVNELLERRRLSDLRRALSLNDRFYFRRELFGGNESRMNQVIDRLNGFPSLEESLTYLHRELEWNLDDQAVADFIKLIEKRYT